MPSLVVHMVDPGHTIIPSTTASSTLLGYMGISSGLTFASTATDISTINTSTTFVSGTGPSESFGGGGGRPGPPPPLLPRNRVLNTILQKMGQLQL